MSDITKCRGENCQLKHDCYRFTARSNDMWQSYFVQTPIKDEKCTEFWNIKEQA